MTEDLPVPVHTIERLIRPIRGQRVMLDADIAALYGSATKTLIQAVRRNAERFPADFMFQLTSDEFADLRSQSVTSRSWGGRRYAPYAFTEQGVAMLSSVLNSPRAVQVNIEIMRTFVRLRGFIAAHEELVHRVDGLEVRLDEQLTAVFKSLRALTAPPPVPQRKLGFKEEQAQYNA